jgi:hypothetical protein
VDLHRDVEPVLPDAPVEGDDLADVTETVG